jgi:hypothetical protein
MAKRKIILVLQLIMSFFGACNGQNRNELIDSVWEKKGEFCSDSLHFYSNGEYQEYYCEFQEYVKGNYHIKGDTLTLIEYKLSSEVVSDNPKSVPTYVWKYIFLEPGMLQKVYYEDLISGEKDIGIENTWKYALLPQILQNN